MNFRKEIIMKKIKFRKILSVFIAVIMTTFLSTTVFASTGETEQPIYVVAGSAELCGVHWNGDPEQVPDNVMEKVGEVYKKTFKDVAPAQGIEFKIVEYYDYGTSWIGCGDNSFIFNNLITCDITITLYPETKEVTITGEGVELITDLEIENIKLFGNGSGTWLNGANWNIYEDANIMTEIEEKIYQITFDNVEAYDYYEFKFLANNTWTDSWSGVYEGSGVESEAVFNNNNNIVLNAPYDNSDITITLDLRNFNYATKQGAKFTVEVNALGDISGDGVINVTDATDIMKYVVGLVDETKLCVDYADVNGDGIINVTDATEIQKFLADLSSVLG